MKNIDVVCKNIFRKNILIIENFVSNIDLVYKNSYNRNQRIWKKYLINQSQACQIKHRQIYDNCLKSFGKLSKEGPDCCRDKKVELILFIDKYSSLN